MNAETQSFIVTLATILTPLLLAVVALVQVFIVRGQQEITKTLGKRQEKKKEGE